MSEPGHLLGGQAGQSLSFGFFLSLIIWQGLGMNYQLPFLINSRIETRLQIFW